MRLDIALVHHRAAPGVLDDRVGRREAGIEVTTLEGRDRGHVGGGKRLGIHAAREHVLVQQRRTGCHRAVEVQHRRQRVVVDADRRQRRGRDARRGRRHRRHRVAVVQHLLARHHVAAEVAARDLGLAARDIALRRRQEILRGHHREHAGQRERGARVDAEDARVRVRAAQHAAPDHARQRVVRAVARAPRDLVDAVGTRRARADLAKRRFLRAHAAPPAARIVAAASSTARMILS